MADIFKKAAEAIVCAKHLIAITGAGISVESGIPDFRSLGGIWEKYDPFEYAHIDAFVRNPSRVWNMIFDMMDLIVNAKPNPAHRALAELEKMGLLHYIITQNIDNLHQVAGSRNVIEYHGNSSRLDCLHCHVTYPVAEFDYEAHKKSNKPPRCPGCNEILKPGVIFFGEMIPQQALVNSQFLAEKTDVIMVIGTSVVVYPASSIPYIVKQRGGTVIELNLEKTGITSSITSHYIQGPVGSTLPELLKQVKKLKS